MRLIVFLGAMLCLSWPIWSASNFDVLERKYSAFTKKNGPGFAVSVFREGRLIHSGTFGYANLKLKSRITERTNFNLASNSKQFTAALALLLEQDGKLHVTDLVSKFIPALSKNYGKLSVDHLIHHTSGLPDYMELCDQRPRVTNADIIEYLSKKSGEFDPGTRFTYSNSGYVVLSEVIQRISGKPFRTLIHERIFSPLGMKTSLIRDEVTENQITSRGIGYNNWPWFEENDAGSCNYNYGDGGVYSNISDFQKWIAALESGSLFKSPYRKKLFTATQTSSGESTNYGYGWAIMKFKEHDMYYHSGAWQGFRSRVAILPTKKLSVVVLSNFVDMPTRDILDQYIESSLQANSN